MNVYISRFGNADFKSPSEAIEYIDKSVESIHEDVQIIFNDNEIYLEYPIEITKKYPFKITFTSKNRCVVSGGVRIGGFEKVDGKPYYAAKVKLKPFRQLYVDGERRTRARSELLTGRDFCAGDFSDKDGIIFNADLLPDIKHSDELEIVWDKCEWRHIRHSVERIENKKDGSAYNAECGLTYVYMKQPYYAYGLKMDNQNMRTYLPYFDKPMYFENALEFLTEPGMWYWSKTDNILYYYPYENENMDDIEIIAPQTEFAVNIAGSRKSRVCGVEFSNLSFKYFTWNAVSERGLPCIQACWLNNHTALQNNRDVSYVEGNVSLKYCDDIAFKNCAFENFGACALRIEVAASDIKIEDCIFKHISEGGIQIGRTSEQYLDENNRDLLVNKIKIARNKFEYIGDEFTAGVGILTFYPYDVLIENNEISHTSYSAVSLGWGWVSDNNTFGKHIVRRNVIHDFMEVLRDGGAIYTLGEQHGTEIYDNYIYNQINEFAAIYTDNGTRNLTASNNVLKNVDISAFPYEPSLYNVKFTGNWLDNCNLVNFGTDCVVNENYLFDVRYFPKPVSDIIKAAGCGGNHLPKQEKIGAYNKIYSHFSIEKGSIGNVDFTTLTNKATALVIDADEIITPKLISLSLHRHGNDQIYSLYISEDNKNFKFAYRNHIYGDCGILLNPDKLSGRYFMITVEHTGQIHNGMIPINTVKIV